MKPIIFLVKDSNEYRYTLKIPLLYIVKERHYKLKLIWWMIKLLWKELLKKE